MRRKQIERRKQIKVVVGLSGGVDSNVAALLLKQAGFDVTGVFLTCWNKGVGCSTEQDRKDAVAVAGQLGIPIKVWDFQRQYQARVIDRFFKEYQRGRTPNPDIWCNEEIKFGLFLEKALEELKVNYIATGHYAIVCVSKVERSSGNENFSGLRDSAFPPAAETAFETTARFARLPSQKLASNKSSTKNFVASASFMDPNQVLRKDTDSYYHLFTGVDPTKDQSYFLYRLNQFQLAHTLFPIGHLTKQQVREIAKQNNLLTAKKPDSQGICFVGKVNLKEFLAKRIDFHKGEVVNTKGEVIGEHEGVEFYTIGQRHGFKISEYQGAPLYVIDKDVKNNRLIVGRDEESEVGKFEVGEVHWIHESRGWKVEGRDEGGGLRVERKKSNQSTLYSQISSPTSTLKSPISSLRHPASNLFVRIRHLGEFIPCKIESHGSNLIVSLTKPTRGVAPGQHAVLYLEVGSWKLEKGRGDDYHSNSQLPTSNLQVLGGGVIQRVLGSRFKGKGVKS